MKTLNQMDETEFLRHCYMIADKVATLLTETQVMELRKVGPILTGSETPDELKAKKEAQGRKNIKAMAKSCCSTMLRTQRSCCLCCMSWKRTRTATLKR